MTSTSSEPTNLLEAVRYFSDDDRAFAFVMNLRWPDGNVTCPRCGVGNPSFIATRRIWKCRGCRKQFSLKVGTIFEDSPLGWDKWLPAIWLLANSKNSVSSHELGRALGVTQKTAWFMFHRIRDAMATRTFRKLDGEVEADETYVGPNIMNMHKRVRQAKGLGGRGGHPDKAIVAGIVERGGEVRAMPVPDTQMDTLHGNVLSNVAIGATLYADENRSYNGLDQYYALKRINHSREYVSGNTHTNTIENFWSLLKRSIKGTQVHVDPEHLHRYVTERSFSYNHRTDTDLGRMRLAVSGAPGRRLTWVALTDHR